MKSEWFLLRTLFPQVQVIWSALIPQSPWRKEAFFSHSGGIRPSICQQLLQHTSEEFKRIVMDNAMGSCIRSLGGNVIEHPRILSKDPRLYLDEGLTHAGLDIFLEDIRKGILTHVLQSSGATGGGLQEGTSLPPPASPAAPSGLAAVSQEAATREDKVASSSEEGSSAQINPGEAAGSIQAETSGVVLPSPQPGASGTCKAGIKDVKQKLEFGSFPLCSGSSGSKPRIWICGHSMVDAAHERAATTRMGSQLALHEEVVLEWHGWYGLTWVGLIPFLQDLATYRQPPDVLIIHLGEMELMYTQHIGFLTKTIQRELFLVKELFPNAKVVWSETMPWGQWPGVLPFAADKLKSLWTVNANVALFVKGHGGAVIQHPGFLRQDLKLYDEAKLSDAGLDIFLEDIKSGILAHLQLLRAARKGLEEDVRSPPAASPATLPRFACVTAETATREDKAVSSTEEASGMQTSAGEASGSSQPVSSKAETSGVASPSPQPGTPGPCKAENQDVEQKLVVSIPLCSVHLSAEAAVSSQPVSSKAETPDVASLSPQPRTSGPCEAESKGVVQEPVFGSVPSCPGEVTVRIMAETSGVASPSPQPGTSGPCKVESEEVEQKLVVSVPLCSGEAAGSSQPVSRKAETSDGANPSPQPETSGPCKVESEDVEQKTVVSVPLGSGEAAGSPQPVSIKVETSGVASPSPQPGTPGPCKAKNQDVEQVPLLESVPPCPREAAGSSQPVSSKAETSDGASPSLQPVISGSCKAKNQDVHQKEVAGSVSPCPGEAAGSSQPVSSKAETSGVASLSPQPGAPGPCKAKNQDVEQELIVSVPLGSSAVKTSRLPVSSPAGAEKSKGLPTSSVMNYYYTASPRVYPDTCSLCNAECKRLKDWIQQQNVAAYIENCRRRYKQSPDRNPESHSSSKRHECDGRSTYSPGRYSASPSPKRSRHSSSSHARHRSRSRSPGYHRSGQPRSRSPSHHHSPRHRSRSPQRSRNSGTRSTRSSSKERGSERSTRSAGSHYDPSDVKAKRPEAGGVPDKGGLAVEGKTKKLPKGAPTKDTSVARPPPCHRLLSDKVLGCGSVLCISDLPDDGYTDQDIEKIVLPFGKVSDFVVIRSQNEAFVEMNDKEAAMAAVKHGETVPALVNGRRVKISIAEKPKPLPSQKKGNGKKTVQNVKKPTPSVKTKKDKTSSAAKRPQTSSAVTPAAKPGEKKPGEAQKAGETKAGVEQKKAEDPVKSKGKKAPVEQKKPADPKKSEEAKKPAVTSKITDTKKSADSKAKETNNSTDTPGTADAVQSTEAGDSATKEAEETCAVVVSNLPEAGLSLDETSNLTKPFGGQKDASIASSHKKVFAGRNTRSSNSGAKPKEVFAGRRTRSSNRGANPKEEEELPPNNLDEFVTVDEVTDEVETPSQPKRYSLRSKRKAAAHEPSSKRRKGKTSVARGAPEQELSSVTLDKIGEDKGGTAPAAEHLEAMPDPQVLVTVDEVNDEEEQISKVSLVALDEIHEDSDDHPLVTLDEAMEEYDDFLEGELNFVTVDEVGSEDEEEEKNVTSTVMEEPDATAVPEEEIAAAEPTEGLPLAAKQEETVIRDDASPGREKASPGEDLPEEKKASEAQMEVVEKEGVAAEIDTQETTLVETEKGEGGKEPEQNFKEETEAEAQQELPLAGSTSNVTERQDKQGSETEDSQQPSDKLCVTNAKELESHEEDTEAKAIEMDVEGCSESAPDKEETGDVATPAPAPPEASVGEDQTAGREDPEAGSEQLGQDPDGKEEEEEEEEESCSELAPSQSSEKPEKATKSHCQSALRQQNKKKPMNRKTRTMKKTRNTRRKRR